LRNAVEVFGGQEGNENFLAINFLYFILLNHQLPGWDFVMWLTMFWSFVLGLVWNSEMLAALPRMFLALGIF